MQGKKVGCKETFHTQVEFKEKCPLIETNEKYFDAQDHHDVHFQTQTHQNSKIYISINRNQ